ncbi:MAG: VOC family protein [Candidatus Binataceae bacterium]|nr:VOC family protein [Candidatus Binataceae bacterium]
MKRAGVHHLGLVTLDLERTIEFYTNKLGWKIAWCDMMKPLAGGVVKHVFFDTGDGCFVSFMCPDKMPNVPAEFSTDLNTAQNLPGFFYHFAFWVDSVEELEEKRQSLTDKGVEVTGIGDHDWAKSIYFRDPNGMLLEYCVTVRPLGEEDQVMRDRSADNRMFGGHPDSPRWMQILSGRSSVSAAR